MMWELIVAVSALVGAVVPLVCAWPWWAIPLTAVVCYAALVVLWILFAVTVAFSVGKKEPYLGRGFCYRVMVHTAHLVDRLCNVSVRVDGDAFPDTPCLLIANHRSMFDPIVMIDAFPDKTVAYISKPENFRIPAVGQLVRYCGFMAIDRESPRNAMKTIHRAVDTVRAGMSVAVYPEGKRSKTGELLPFHNGVLKIAQKAKVPVAVVAVDGTEKIAHRAPFRRTTVTVRVVTVIPPEEFAESTTAALADRARDALVTALDTQER